MAAPHVTGAAAVLHQAFPFLTAPQIAQTMFTTATHLGDGPSSAPNDTFGWGLLNLGKAIDGLGQSTSTWTVNTTYNGQAYYGRFANDIAGAGGLIKTGLGILELAGTNTYAGGTAVYGGTLAVSRDANLGAAGTGLTLGGGTLEVLADGFATAPPAYARRPRRPADRPRYRHLHGSDRRRRLARRARQDRAWHRRPVGCQHVHRRRSR